MLHAPLTPEQVASAAARARGPGGVAPVVASPMPLLYAHFLDTMMHATPSAQGRMPLLAALRGLGPTTMSNPLFAEMLGNERLAAMLRTMPADRDPTDEEVVTVLSVVMFASGILTMGEE